MTTTSLPLGAIVRKLGLVTCLSLGTSVDAADDTGELAGFGGGGHSASSKLRLVTSCGTRGDD